MNNKAKYSLIAGIVGLIIAFFAIGVFMFAIVFALGVAAIVLSVLAKKELKKAGKGKGQGQATAGLVLGIITIGFVLLGVIGLIALSDVDITSQMYCPKEMEMVEDCKIDEDGITATCMYMDTMEIKCYVDVLDESQYAATKSE